MCFIPQNDIEVIITKKQKEVLNYIVRYIDTYGYAPTVVEIGDGLGLSSTATVHKHLSNLESLGLIRRDFHRQRAIKVIQHQVDSSQDDVIQIPLIGVISAGKLIELTSPTEFIKVSHSMVADVDAFAFQVKGDSMINEHICDGDLIVAEKHQIARNGNTVIALLKEHKILVNKYYQDRDMICLRSLNPDLPPIYCRMNEIQIQGIVIGLLRKYDR